MPRPAPTPPPAAPPRSGRGGSPRPRRARATLARLGRLALLVLLAATPLGCGEAEPPRLRLSPAARARWQPDAPLAAVFRAVAAHPDVQPGHPDWHGDTDTTWCNRGFVRVARANGHDPTALLDPDPHSGRPDLGWTSANDLVRNARVAAAQPDSGVVRVDARRAQALADAGRTVMAAWSNPRGHGHVGHVAPSSGAFDETEGPLVFETGATIGIRTAREAFPDVFGAVEYYALPFAR